MPKRGLVTHNLHGGCWLVCSASLSTIRKLEPATLAMYADAVAQKPEDDESTVRNWAVDTIGMLDQPNSQITPEPWCTR